MTKSKIRNRFLSPEQLRKAKIILRGLWSEVWLTASRRHQDEQRFAEIQAQPAKEKPEEKYRSFVTESGFRSRTSR